MEKETQLEYKRHSLAHLLGAAILEIYPKAKITLGPAIENGFYYDIDIPEKVTDSDLPKIEKKMKEILKTWTTFQKKILTKDEALEIFRGNEYKEELIKGIADKDEEISIYTSGKFSDLCRGGHVENAQDIGSDSFKLDRVAGAYWRGDEKNKMLTRIYGLAFNDKTELETYLLKQEEAKKRDHRVLGKELDLFHIDEKVGLGLPLWHPKGAIIWRTIEEFWYREHLRNGYGLVRTPHIGNRTLWETSGHWGFYSSSMYPPIEVGQSLEEEKEHKKIENSEQYLLKPMNCPFHVQIYKNSPKSYRDLPIRYAECGTVYRYEKKGELSGLTRVRGFTQDDAHIICRRDQVEEELKKVIDFILFIYKAFGFDAKDVKVFLSLRDPENKNKYAGTDEGWDFTENVLRKVATEKKLDFIEEQGEAAFYGPKLDFKIKDVLGRMWQCSTLQFDFNLPERFQMTFTSSEGKDEKPYMLHRALFGSFERFIGLLIENYGGAFPIWLSPIQIIVLPISEHQREYTQSIFEELRRNDIRVEIDDSNESLGKRIRNAKIKKVPYIIVVGDKEKESKTITVEGRKEKLENIKVEKFLERIEKEIKERTLN